MLTLAAKGPDSTPEMERIWQQRVIARNRRFRMSARMIHETPGELWVLSNQRTITLLDLVADLLEDGITDCEVVEQVMDLVTSGRVHLIGQVVGRDLLAH
jgi:hypothetical protein